MSDDYSIECPRCGNEIEIIVDELPEGSGTVTCDECGAELEYQYSVSVEFTDVDILSTPTVEVECPVCNNVNDFGEVEEETGSGEITCEDCGAGISFTWSDWGQDVAIDSYDEPETEEDDEDEDDDKEKEEDDEDKDDDEDEADKGEEDIEEENDEEEEDIDDD
ncbi:MAG: hypothetical protein A2V66_12180 [Ignavibacteria bacterium RBG_13_36_8]|nr:MAG: hypothetical protein A2V66_12180 [Ignavibacteria bacterium RBG_13_36_8]